MRPNSYEYIIKTEGSDRAMSLLSSQIRGAVCAHDLFSKESSLRISEVAEDASTVGKNFFSSDLSENLFELAGYVSDCADLSVTSSDKISDVANFSLQQIPDLQDRIVAALDQYAYDFPSESQTAQYDFSLCFHRVFASVKKAEAGPLNENIANTMFAYMEALDLFDSFPASVRRLDELCQRCLSVCGESFSQSTLFVDYRTSAQHVCDVEEAITGIAHEIYQERIDTGMSLFSSESDIMRDIEFNSQRIDLVMSEYETLCGSAGGRIAFEESLKSLKSAQQTYRNTLASSYALMEDAYEKSGLGREEVNVCGLELTKIDKGLAGIDKAISGYVEISNHSREKFLEKGADKEK